MQLRMQPSGAQLGHVPSAPVTEVQRIAKHGSQQQQSTPSEIVHAAHSHGNGAHGSPQAVFGGVESASENASASDDMPAAKPGRPASSDLPHPLDRIPDDPSLKPDETEFIKAQLQYDWQGHVVDCEAAYHSSTPKRVIDAIGVRPSDTVRLFRKCVRFRCCLKPMSACYTGERKMRTLVNQPLCG